MLFAYYVPYLKFSLSSDSSSADSKRVPDVSEALDPTDLSPSASSRYYTWCTRIGEGDSTIGAIGANVCMYPRHRCVHRCIQYMVRPY